VQGGPAYADQLGQQREGVRFTESGAGIGIFAATQPVQAVAQRNEKVDAVFETLHFETPVGGRTGSVKWVRAEAPHVA